MKLLVLFVLVWAPSLSFYAMAQPPVPAGTIQKCTDNLEWKEAPAPFAPGAQISMLEGSPKSEGHFTVRFKLPPHFIIPPHYHSKDERVTVLSGSIFVGFGDTLQRKRSTRFTAGCYYVNPVNFHHYVYTEKEEAIIQISGIGPWTISFLEEK